VQRRCLFVKSTEISALANSPTGLFREPMARRAIFDQKVCRWGEQFYRTGAISRMNTKIAQSPLTAGNALGKPGPCWTS
jgi:hypothetical protein